MSLGGSEETTTSEERAYLPSWIKRPIQGITKDIQGLMDREYEGYGGERIQDFSPEELQAMQMTRDLVGQNSLDPSMGISQEVARRGLEGFSQAELQPYMNPYTENVLDVQKRRSLEDFDRREQTLSDQAGQVGAFGGSRMGLSEQGMRDDFSRQLADQEVMGLSNAYSQGLGAAMQGTQMAGMAGMDLANLTQNQRGMQFADAGALSGVGAQQRSMDQQGLDLAHQDFLQEQNFGYEQAKFGLGSLMPVGQLMRGSDSTTTKSSGGGMGLSDIVGIASMVAAPFTGGASLAMAGGLAGMAGSAMSGGGGGGAAAGQFGMETGGQSGFAGLQNAYGAGAGLYGPGFNEGGEVQGYAEGGQVEGYTMDMDPRMIAMSRESAYTPEGNYGGLSGGMDPRMNAMSNESAYTPEGDIDMGVDFDFIRQREGTELKGYVPKEDGAALGKSGVTVGTGFDIGQNNLKGLKDLGLSEALQKKLTPYLGLKKDKAIAALAETPLKLTKTEVKSLDEKVKARELGALRTKYKKATGKDFDSLPSAIQTPAASVAFQYGDMESETPNFWKQLISDDFEGMYNNLRDFKDDYSPRRNLEADIIQGYLQQPSPQILMGGQGLDTLEGVQGYASGGMVESLKRGITSPNFAPNFMFNKMKKDLSTPNPLTPAGQWMVDNPKETAGIAAMAIPFGGLAAKGVGMGTQGAVKAGTKLAQLAKANPSFASAIAGAGLILSPDGDSKAPETEASSEMLQDQFPFMSQVEPEGFNQGQQSQQVTQSPSQQAPQEPQKKESTFNRPLWDFGAAMLSSQGDFFQALGAGAKSFSKTRIQDEMIESDRAKQKALLDSKERALATQESYLKMKEMNLPMDNAIKQAQLAKVLRDIDPSLNETERRQDITAKLASSGSYTNEESLLSAVNLIMGQSGQAQGGAPTSDEYFGKK